LHSTGAVTLDTTLLVTGIATFTAVPVFTSGIGPASVTTLHATGAVTLDTTSLHTGVATFTAVPVFNAGLASLSVAGASTFADTVTSATPATERLVRSDLTLTPATTLAVGTNGSLAAVRGCVTLTSGKSITQGYLYGVEGKLVLDGATVAIGSDHAAGVYAQLSAASAPTFTSGHVAILICSGQNLPSIAGLDGIYVESGNPTGGADGINSVLKAICDSTYLFDVSGCNGAGCVSSAVGVQSGTFKKIAVKVGGTAMYLVASTAVS
jgi:hypothetical protein